MFKESKEQNLKFLLQELYNFHGEATHHLQPAGHAQIHACTCVAQCDPLLGTCPPRYSPPAFMNTRSEIDPKATGNTLQGSGQSRDKDVETGGFPQWMVPV